MDAAKGRGIPLAFAAIVAACPLWAGDKAENGGEVIACRDTKGAITSIELRDLHDGAAYDGLLITRSDSPVDRQLEAALAKLALVPDVQRHLRSEVAFIRKTLVVLPNERTGLSPTGASSSPVYDKLCRVERLARYDEGIVRVDREYFTNPRFRKTDEAAFYLHAAVSKFYGDVFDTGSSDDVRRLVAGLFAESVDEPALAKMLARSTRTMTRAGERNVIVDPGLGPVTLRIAYPDVTCSLFGKKVQPSYFVSLDDMYDAVEGGRGAAFGRAGEPVIFEVPIRVAELKGHRLLVMSRCYWPVGTKAQSVELMQNGRVLFNGRIDDPERWGHDTAATDKLIIEQIQDGNGSRSPGQVLGASLLREAERAEAVAGFYFIVK